MILCLPGTRRQQIHREKDSSGSWGCGEENWQRCSFTSQEESCRLFAKQCRMAEMGAEEHRLLSWGTWRGLLEPAWQLTTICGSSSRESQRLLTQSSGTRHTSSAQTHLQAKQPTHEIN